MARRPGVDSPVGAPYGPAVRHALAAAGLAVALLAPGVARAEEASPVASSVLPREGACPRRIDKVLAIGSSTMGSPLGTILERAFAREGLTSKRLAAASSGLARPDFWSWAEHGARLIAEHDPDVVVVQLGSNDYQPVWGAGPPIRRQHPDWVRVYAQRIDELLEVLGGDRERLIIWVGPYAYWGDNALEQGPVIDRLLRERLAVWVERGGLARYVDAWTPTFDPRRGPIMKRRVPGVRGLVDIRSKDNVHLNTDAVRMLLADPTVAYVGACLEEVHATAAADAMSVDRGRSPATSIAPEPPDDEEHSQGRGEPEARP